MSKPLKMPLSKEELKHLIWLHVKRDGLTYEEAKKQVELDIKQILDLKDTMDKKIGRLNDKKAIKNERKRKV